MEFRKITEIEAEYVYLLGYPEWGYDISWQEYVEDCCHEDKIGIRYVLVDNEMILGTLILFKHSIIIDNKNFDLYGIGSVIVPTIYRGKSLGKKLITECIKKYNKDNAIFLLYSSINPDFYKKLGFVELSKNFQYEYDLSCLVYCKKEIYQLLVKCNVEDLPKSDFGCYS